MLALRFQFLQGTYQAAAPGRMTTAEWPPHPARMHAALVAAGWARGDGGSFPDDALGALRWLESLGPPSIATPTRVGTRTTTQVFVPRNLTRAEVGDARSRLRRGGDVGRQIGRVDRTFPTRVPGDEAVWFFWPTAEPSLDQRKALQALAEEVHYLGSSRSPVCCDVADEPPEPTYRPVPGRGQEALRVAIEGMTDELVASRGEAASVSHGHTVAYAPPTSDPLRASSGPFEALVVLRRAAGFGLTVQHAALLSRSLRRAVLAVAGDAAPAILHGHGRSPHAAFLALPNVGHPSSTGEILGVAVAVPRDADGEERDSIVSAARAVKSLAIHEGVTPWQLEPAEDGPARRTLDPATWVAASRRWTSATPVILDRHPKAQRRESVADMVKESFANALLPVPTDVRTARYPWLPGAVPAALHTGHGLPTGLRVHIDVEFDHEVAGPVLVGRGRYFGIGLLRPA